MILDKTPPRAMLPQKPREESRKLSEKIKDKLNSLGELIGVFVPMTLLFGYVHHENVHINERLDSTIMGFQRSIDEVHKRCDEQSRRSDQLHKEYYDLLKEMRHK